MGRVFNRFSAPLHAPLCGSPVPSPCFRRDELADRLRFVLSVTSCTAGRAPCEPGFGLHGLRSPRPPQRHTRETLQARGGSPGYREGTQSPGGATPISQAPISASPTLSAAPPETDDQSAR